MSDRYPLTSSRIQEVIKAPKQIIQPLQEVLLHASSGSKGIAFKVDVELMDEDFIPMVLRGRTTSPADPQAYHLILTVYDERLRGVDFQELPKRKGYKEQIPKGWHQNVIDPNLSSKSGGYNRHIPIPNFKPTDFVDFIRKVAAMWNIDLREQDQLL